MAGKGGGDGRHGGGGGALVPDLLRPEAYPSPRPQAVELRTTHASWVFLTEGEAWKVKRPVDYGFLDFTTAALRLADCEAEVRLGRRTAPDVYRGIEAVRLGAGGHTFAGQGDVVDHAVRMRRLPDEDSAQALLAAGRLGPAHLERLAQRLARFYAEAPPTPRYGELDVIAANVRENFEQVRPFVGRFVDAALFERVQTAHVGFLERGAAALVARRAQERIRDGHGDLRLEHVYFAGGSPAVEPLVIDAIEFNERFRCGDVAADVAFFAMELDAQGRRDLGEAFLAAFARASADYGLYTVVDFYLGYRAWVRAKVACFVAADPSTPPDKVARKRDEAFRLFALADAYAGAAPLRAAVIVVGGLPGAGKSTLADALARAASLPVVSSDETRKQLAGLAPTERGPASLYGEAFTRRTFDEVFRRAEMVLAAGRGVILDATFRSVALRTRAREAAARHRQAFLFVEARCDEATLVRRLRARAGGPSVSDADEAVLARVKGEFEPPIEMPAHERVEVDTTRPSVEAADFLLRRLGLRP